LIAGENVTIENPERYVWLSESLWHNAYHGNTSVINQIITIENKDYIIAGVIEDVLAIQSDTQVLNQQYWIISDPKNSAALMETGAISGYFDTILLKQNQNTEIPSEEDISQWQKQYIQNNLPAENVSFFLQWMENLKAKTKLRNYRDTLLGESTSLITALSIAVFALLIMATLNLLNIFIAHYQSRSQEFAIQLTTGASRTKLKTMIWLENLPLFLLAIITGLLVTGWLLKLLPVLGKGVIPIIQSIQIDNITIIASIIIVLIINAIFSALSLLHINTQQLADNLNNSGKGTPAQINNHISKSLMILQIAIASILLTATTMLAMQSYQAVYRDLGYDFSNSYEIQFKYASVENTVEQLSKNLSDPDYVKALHIDITNMIEKTITNSEVIIASNGPLSGSISINTVSNDEHSQPIMFRFQHLSENYFSAFKIPFLAGSNLTQAQIDSGENRIVIDELMAKLLFPKLSFKEIIGKDYLLDGGEHATPSIIAGIVPFTFSNAGNISGTTLPAVYQSRISLGLPTFSLQAPSITHSEKQTLITAIKQKHPQFDDIKLESLNDMWLQQTRTQRISLWVIITIALLTVFLASLGISGLTQMTTNNRKYELAIRMATGAKRTHLVNLVLKEGFWMLFIGLAAGVILSVFGYGNIQQTLSMLPDFNWQAMLILDLGLIFIVIISVILPAWRVINNDPMQTLREE